MSDFINSVPVRRKALAANQKTIADTTANNIFATQINPSEDLISALSESIIVTTDSNTDVTTDSNTTVTTTKYKLKLKPKEKAELITIRIIKSNKEKLDKLARKHSTTRQEIINEAFNLLFKSLGV